MKGNVNNFSCLVEIGKTFYQCDFDHKSIDILQTVTGKGFYSLYNEFVFNASLSNKDVVNILAVSAYKHHGAFGMQKMKSSLIANPEISLNELATFKAHFKNLLPDKNEFQKELKFINPKAKQLSESSDFYNFEDAYAIAKNFLGWSDDDFWLATPRKFCFALISLAKFNKEREDFSKKIQTENCINFLNGIKKLL